MSRWLSLSGSSIGVGSGSSGRAFSIGAAPAPAHLALGADNLPAVVVDVEVVPGEAIVPAVLQVGPRSGPETVTW